MNTSQELWPIIVFAASSLGLLSIHLLRRQPIWLRFVEFCLAWIVLASGTLSTGIDPFTVSERVLTLSGILLAIGAIVLHIVLTESIKHAGH